MSSYVKKINPETDSTSNLMDVLNFSKNMINTQINDKSTNFHQIIKILPKEIAIQRMKLAGLTQEEINHYYNAASLSNSDNNSDSIMFTTKRSIPILGLGTYQMNPNECESAVLNAIKVGYRLIDTARIYRNEIAVGNGIRKAISNNYITKRSDIFITSKIAPTEQGEERAYIAVQKTLESLGFSKSSGDNYIDLMLIHWPGVSKTPLDSGMNSKVRKGSYKALVRAQNEGLVKDIGVSNFMIKHLQDLEESSLPLPVINQFECHPYCTQIDLREYCYSKGIIIQAYSSLGRGSSVISNSRVNNNNNNNNNDNLEISLLCNPKVVQISQEINATTAQVLLLWAIQQGICVIPKSVNEDRIEANYQVMNRFINSNDYGMLLDDGQIKNLTDLHNDTHYCWNPNKVTI